VSKNKIVCVLGMHRSGTSMLMRLLNICGVYVGENDECSIEPTESNAMGHWENKEILEINEKILKLLGGSWDNPPVFSKGWEASPKMKNLRKRATDYIASMNSRSKVWGFKDPRTCLTIEFWRKIIPDMLYIIPLRDSFEVALSLKKRDGSSIEKGLFLWTWYHTNIMNNTSESKRFFTLQREYFEDWKSELRKVINFINEPSVSLSGKEKEIKSFIKPSLLHNKISTENYFHSNRGKINKNKNIILEAYLNEFNKNIERIYREDKKLISQFRKKHLAESILLKKATESSEAYRENNHQLKKRYEEKENEHLALREKSAQQRKELQRKIEEKENECLDLKENVNEVNKKTTAQITELQFATQRFKRETDYMRGQLELLKNDLSRTKNSLRWLIPNYFYKFYQNRIKKFIPRFVFEIAKPLFIFLNRLRGNDHTGIKNEYHEDWRNSIRHNNFSDLKIKGSKKYLLFFDRGLPTFDKDAGSFATFEYLRTLAKFEYNIIFWPVDKIRREPYLTELKKIGIQVALNGSAPEDFLKRYGSNISISVLSRPNVATEIIDSVKKYTRSKVIYIGHDLHYLREKREAKVRNDLRKKIKSGETKRMEIAVMEKSDLALFFSHKEIEILRNEYPMLKTAVLPWIQEMNIGPKSLPFNQREGIMFLGGFIHQPNVDSLLWFHREIFPIIKRAMPDVKVYVIGSDAPESILNLNSNDFRIMGFVPERNLASFMNERKIFVAPLRYGAGFKGKIARAMSFGLPVVTTSIGAEGIGLADGENSFIADNADEFAKKTVKLYNDELIWSKISNNSAVFISENCSAERAKNILQKILCQV